MIRLWLTLGAAGSILAASPARAQDVGPPRVEIGGTFSGILSIVSEDGPVVLAGAGPRVTVNVTRRFGVELLAEVLGPVEFSGTMALYQAQLEFHSGQHATGNEPCRSPSELLASSPTGALGRRESRDSTDPPSCIRGSGGSRSRRPRRSASAWRGTRRSAAPSRAPWPCTDISARSGAWPCGHPSGWRSVLEAIDDHDRASRDPARGPDGWVRYRAALGICHSGSRGAESSSHCAAVRVGYARRAGDLDEQSSRARIARAGRIRRRSFHQNRSSGPRMAASWSRSAPPANGVRTLSIRYRWQPDPDLPPAASQTALVTAHFQTTGPVVGYDPNAQGAASGTLQPRGDWTDIALIPGQFKPPIEVEFCYLHSFGANRGVLEVDRIELVRNQSLITKITNWTLSDLKTVTSAGERGRQPPRAARRRCSGKRARRSPRRVGMRVGGIGPRRHRRRWLRLGYADHNPNSPRANRRARFPGATARRRPPTPLARRRAAWRSDKVQVRD